MGRLVGRGLVAVLVTAAVVYVGDFAVWRVRAARGGGMGSVTVTRIVVAPLKGNKEEYYPDGTMDVACSKSLFEQAGSGACWWLARHRQVEER
jgi:hypothetical protein